MLMERELKHEAHQAHEEDCARRERFGSMIVDSGLKIHRAFGPGLLESAYEHTLAYELHTRGLAVSRQVVLPIVYEGTKLDAGYRIDLLVEQSIIIEVKAVESLTRVHESQLMTYLKLSGCRLGFLMNFHVSLFKNGLKRMVM